MLVSDDHFAVELGGITGNEYYMHRIHRKRMSRLRCLSEIISSSTISESRDYRRLVTTLNRFSKLEQGMNVHSDEPIRLEPPRSLNGNHVVWAAFRHIIKNSERISAKAKKEFRVERNRIEQAVLSAQIRSSLDMKRTPRILGKIIEHIDFFAQMNLVRSEIKRELDRSRKFLEEKISKWKRSGYDRQEIPSIELSELERRKPVLVRSLGNLLLLKLYDKEFILPQTHCHKLMDIISTHHNLSMATLDMSCRNDPKEMIEDWLSSIEYLIDEDPNFIGEAAKGARTLLISLLEEDKILGEESFDLARRAMDPYRREHAQSILSYCRDSFIESVDAVNFLNIYKAIPHPDVNTESSFSSIEGLRNPNKTNPLYMTRFAGTLRRSLFKSLASIHSDVRLTASSEAGMDLMDIANRTQRSMASLSKRSFIEWAATEFLMVRGVQGPIDLTIPASDKASQIRSDASRDKFMEAVDWAKGLSEMPEELEKARTLNDAAAKLQGKTTWSMREAIIRFQAVISLHERMEAGWPGTPIEDIPAYALQQLVMNNPQSRYLVGTEPKLGEFHKKVSRVFYMAEQDLKMLTQATERIAKQISRRQPGVSIVKSYSARRADLEHFCAAVTGPNSDRKSTFVSFDMSEFSKKFPMPLVRVFGKVLAEVTGENWLERIDLFFRSSVVISNARGYFNCLSGVKGAFEGFLNFVWSSIHSVVMEIALESTGVSGELLTFSDDGLLLFFTPPHMMTDEIRAKIVRIQEIYREYGLTFHLGKTLVSHSMWEYLGDVCRNGRLLPMWMKEIITIGHEDQTRGLTPIRMRLNSFQGQANAACSAGSNTLLAYVLMHINATRLISRVHERIGLREIEGMLIVPTACGGFRIESPIELASKSGVESHAEFVADLELMHAFDPSLSSQIVETLSAHMPSSRDAINTILQGGRFKTAMPDTSGLSVINDAIEIARANAVVGKTLATNPLTMSRLRDMKRILTKTANISPKQMQDLVFSTPAWADYSASMSLMRGGGALRIISRRDLKRLQVTDTRNCVNSIKVWYSYLNDSRIPIQQISGKLASLEASFLKDFDVVPLKLSSRSLLRVSHDPSSAHIKVKVNAPIRGYSQSMPYVEPNIRFPQDTTQLAWFAESSGDKAITSSRKFLSACSRFLSSSPDSADLLSAFGRVFGISIPTIPAGLVRSGHRRSAASNASLDVRLSIPRSFWGRSESHYINDLHSKIYKMKRADRTTYLELARAMSYLLDLQTYSGADKEDPGVRIFYFMSSEDLWDGVLTNHEMILREYIHNLPIGGQLDDRFQKEYRETFIDNMRAKEQLENIDSLNWKLSGVDELERAGIISITSRLVSKWIEGIVLTQGSGLLPTRTLPSLPAARGVILRDALCMATWNTIDPRVKGVAGRALSFYYDYKNNLKENAPNLDDLPENFRVPVTTFWNHLLSIADALIDLDDPNIPSSEIENIVNVTLNPIIALAHCVVSISLVPKAGPKKVLIRPRGIREGMMSSAHQVLLRQAFSATLINLQRACKDAKWDPVTIAALTGINLNIDDLLDWTIVCRNLIRSSTHRTAHRPYNTTTARIEMVKFYLAIGTALRQYPLDVPGASESVKRILETFTMDQAQIHQLTKLLRAGAELIDMGEDHQIILSKPLHREVVGRAFLHWKYSKYGVISRKTVGTIPYRRRDVSRIFQSVNQLLTAAYNVVIVPSLSNIVEYPANIEALVQELPQLPSSIDALSIPLEVTLDHVSGVETVVQQAPEVMQRLIGEHLKAFALRSGISGFSIKENVGNWLPIALGEHGIWNPNGPVLEKLSRSKRGEVSIVCLRLNNPSNTIATYINLATESCSSLSMLRNPVNNAYYVIGVTAASEVKLSPETDLAISGVPEEHLRAFVPAIGIEDNTSIVKISNTEIARGTRRRVRLAATALGIESYRRVTNRPNEINSDSPSLQAAIYLSRRDGSPSNQLWCYTLFVNFIRRHESRNTADRMFRQLSSIVRTGREADKYALVADISQIITWLRLCNIDAGVQLRADEIESYMVRIPEEVRLPNIYESVAFFRPRTLASIISDIIPDNPRIGRLGARLIVLEYDPSALEYSELDDEGAEPMTLDDLNDSREEWSEQVTWGNG